MAVDEVDELIDRLSTAYRVLLALGLFDYAGQASCRVPGTDEFLIRGARIHIVPLAPTRPTEVAPTDILRINLQGEVLEGDLTMPLETPMHTAIFRRRPDVNAVVHAHSTMIQAFSMAKKEILPMYSRGLESTGGPIPIFDNSDPVTTDELGEELANTLGEGRACMLKSHGVATVGPTLESACLAAINLEEAAYMQWVASFLGPLSPLSRDEIATRQKLWDSDTYVDSVWRYFDEATQDGRMPGRWYAKF